MCRLVTRAVVAAALAAVAIGSLTAGSAPPARPNVLLVTIDTLRADRVGSYGYQLARTPVLDRLAREGVRFEDATVQVPLTYPSHAAILTGRYPSRFGIRVNSLTPLPPSVPTIATRLKAAGYRTAAFVASAILDPSYGLNRGFDVYDADLGRAPAATVALAELQRPAGDVIASVGRWLDSAPAQPWFAWVHLFDPHYPYEPPAQYLKLAGGRPYDGEVAYADASLGTLVARLDAASTVLVVTSDHGESLGEHGEDDHGYFLYDSTLKVPLIVRAPGLAPRVVREQVRSIDLAPTIEALAGLTPEAGQDGESLVALLRGQARRDVPPSYAETWYPRLHFAWSELRSLRVGEWKYVAAPKPELYDLRVDGGELKNAIAQRGNVAGRLADEMAALTARVQPASGEAAKPSAQPQPDPETVRRLQALGYIGAFAPAAATTSTIDPKDKVTEYKAHRRRLTLALNAMNRGEPGAAVAILKQMLASNVRAFEVHLYLGNAYAARREFDAALGEYDAAHQLNPELAQVHFEAAKALSTKGDAEAAVARCRQGLALEPSSPYGLYTLGVIYQRAGRYAEAAETYGAAIATQERDPRLRANLAEVAMRLGQVEVAREQYEKMIELKYQVAPAHFNLGFIAERAGDRARALRHYRESAAADPKFKPAQDALARLK